MDIHAKNIAYITRLLQEKVFHWIERDRPSNVSYFASGGGTHLYLIDNNDNKFLTRINFYAPKNEWKIKRAEYETLKAIEPLHIAPRVFFLDEDNELEQDCTIVEYIEGEIISEFSLGDVIALANDLKTLHTFAVSINRDEELPYRCEIYDEFANGEDKSIEIYHFDGIEQVYDLYNKLKRDLGQRFSGLSCFDGCDQLCLCHADLKAENILKTTDGVMMIDRECAGIDIPETDIGRVFSGCRFSAQQQDVFLQAYFDHPPTTETLYRIQSVKFVVDFFRILEDYCSGRRKTFDTQAMIDDLQAYEKNWNIFTSTMVK